MTAIERLPVYDKTKTTTPMRYPDRVTYERDAVHAVLDEALVCHVGYIVDGRPVMIPTLHVRSGDNLYIHGSTGSRLMMTAAKGPVPLCVTVTLTDGLVLAKSWFNHSINYRSVVLFGRGEKVDDPDEKARVLAALVEHLVPGRTADAREANDAELRQTLVIRLPIDEASAKVRTGGPIDDAEDLSLDVWAGVIPLAVQASEPIDAEDLNVDVAPPPYATGYSR